jgi:hypothetical protein
MATVKPNAVQTTDLHEYCVYDSAVPHSDFNDIPLSRSLTKASAKMLTAVIGAVKGADLCGYSVRVLYKPAGFANNPRNTVRFEFTAEFSPHVGVSTNSLVAFARLREGLPALTGMG